MVSCSNCGNKGLLLKTEKCLHCGRECCKRCGTYVLTIIMAADTIDKFACSADCKKNYEQTVLNYPLENVGTDAEEFDSLEKRLWHKACMAALNRNDLEWKTWARLQNEIGMEHAMYAFEIQARSSNNIFKNDLRDRFYTRALLTFAGNIERVGRPLDAADVYEKRLKMYDKARELREKERQLIVRNMNVSLDLNQLLKQGKEGGIVAVYRCSHCGGKLKVDKSTNIAALRVCDHCGSEIEAMELADFIRTALS